MPAHCEAEGAYRFVVGKRVGAGGMGVVYSAYDRERCQVVALKVLRDVAPASLYRFKREFRALAGVSHPNLVTLYELLGGDGQWLFTMELLDGIDFLTHVRGRSPLAAGSCAGRDSGAAGDTAVTNLIGDTTISDPTGGRLQEPDGDAPPESASAQMADPDLLRPALRQLVEAVHALHKRGYLHRDIKPSNVMVTPTGRVVLLDFGVVAELGRRQGNVGDAVAGTVAYMAPELFQAGGAASPASDWYSLGVMLYEALTGARPFCGSQREITAAKLAAEPLSPRTFVTGIPDDLGELCERLLRRAPRARPTTGDLLRAVGARDEAAPVIGPLPGAADILVGRERHLRKLHDAYGRVRRGEPVAVFVHGRSGMGKTSLVERFLADISCEGRNVVLAGRCYEQESVPFKGVDSLVDALCQYLLRLDRQQAEALTPPDVAALARVFPVLRRIDSIADALRRTAATEAPEPTELRRRAFAALRDLLARLAAKLPLVLFIDDLQWGDLDSAPLLVELIGRGAPPLLLVAGYRREDRVSSALLRALFDHAADATVDGGTCSIAVNRLPLPEAHRLAEAALARAGSPEVLAERIARESAGSPYFVHELVRSAASLDTPSPPMTLRSVLRARIGALAPSTRRLLEAIAVAARPLPQSVALASADVGVEQRKVMVALCNAHLVRTSGSRVTDTVEIYHARIRETIVAELDGPALRETHLRLAQAIEASGFTAPESLAIHYHAAGENGRARDYAIEAAGQAAEALAFDRAGELYRLAIELDPDAPDAADLLRRGGESLANAGRGVEAAEAFLRAERLSEGHSAVDLRTAAAGAYLRSGYIDRGIETLAPVLRTIGLRIPRTTRGAVVSILLRRAYIALRGLGYEARSADHVAQERITRLDAAFAAATGMGMTSPMVSASMGYQHFSMALRVGVPTHVGLALVSHAAILSMSGTRRAAKVTEILDRTEREILRGSGDPLLAGWWTLVRSLGHYQVGEFRSALHFAVAADHVFRDRCPGRFWERTTALLCSVWSHYYLGSVRELRTLVGVSIREARARGDLYAMATLCTGVPSFSGLADDAPDRVQEVAERAMLRWSRRGLHLQHCWSLFTYTQCDLYRGEPRRAHYRLTAAWPRLGRSLLLSIHCLRGEMLHLRGRCALALAAQATRRQRARLLREARTCARRMRRLRLPWSDALAAMLRAGADAMEDDRHAAERQLGVALDLFESAEMSLFAAIARRALGALRGGHDGRAAIARADEWMRGQEIRRPDRIANLLAPGLPLGR